MINPAIRKGALGLGAVLALSTPLVAKWEGLSTKPYKDIVGVWTVCYGETRVDMRQYTKSECDDLLSDGVGQYAVALRTLVGRDMPPTVHAAFTSLTYNVGTNALRGTRTLNLLKQGKWRDACNRLTLYNKAGGKVVRGLVNRRKQELELCLSGL